MPTTHRSVRVDAGLSAPTVDLACWEDAALEFARRAPDELVAAAVASMTGECVDVSIGARGFPIDDDAQPQAQWAYTRWASRRGLRPRRRRPGGRTVLTKAGSRRLAAWPVECRRGKRRLVPVLELLGVAPMPGAVLAWRRWPPEWRPKSPTPSRHGCWSSSRDRPVRAQRQA